MGDETPGTEVMEDADRDRRLLDGLEAFREETALLARLAAGRPSILTGLDGGDLAEVEGVGGFVAMAGAVALARATRGLPTRDEAFLLAQAPLEGNEADYAETALLELAERRGEAAVDAAAACAVRTFLLGRRERTAGLHGRLALSRALGLWAAAAGDFEAAAGHVIEQEAAGSPSARITMAVADPERWRSREEADGLIEAARAIAAATEGPGLVDDGSRRERSRFCRAIEAVAIFHSELADEGAWRERLASLLADLEADPLGPEAPCDAATSGLVAALRAGS